MSRDQIILWSREEEMARYTHAKADESTEAISDFLEDFLPFARSYPLELGFATWMPRDARISEGYAGLLWMLGLILI